MRQITFFRGIDVVEIEEVKKLRSFFDTLKEMQEDFNYRDLKNQKYGFVVYSEQPEQNKNLIRTLSPIISPILKEKN